MTRFFAFIALFSFTSLSAFAADMRLVKPPRIQDEPLPGFYLRADLGISKIISASPQFRNVSENTFQPLHGASFSKSYDAGFGFGVKKGFMRYEASVDYRSNANYTDNTTCWSAGCGGVLTQNSAKLDSVTALANVYVDLGTWFSLTPYFGGGLGASYNRLQNFNGQTTSGATLVETDAGKNASLGFAYALMAGSSYALNKNLSLDLGYRYLNQGKASTHTTAIAETPAIDGRWETGRLGSHGVRLGVRYTFD